MLNIKEKNNTWMILSEKIFIHHIKQKKLEKNTNKSKKLFKQQRYLERNTSK